MSKGVLVLSEGCLAVSEGCLGGQAVFGWCVVVSVFGVTGSV